MFFLYYVWFVLNLSFKYVFSKFNKFYNYSINFVMNTNIEATIFNYYWIKFLRYLLGLYFNWDANKSGFIFFIKHIFDYKSELIGEERFFFNKTYKNNTLFTFKSLSNKGNYNFSSLKFLVRQFNFFKNSKLNSASNKFYKFFNFKNNFYSYLVLQKLFYKNFYNISNFYFFYKASNLNLVLLNWFFLIMLYNSNSYCTIYNISYVSDWYKVNFKFFNSLRILKTKLPINLIKLNKKMKEKKIFYLAKIYKTYKKNYKILLKKINNRKYKSIFFLKFFDLYNYKFIKSNLPSIVSNFKIRYSDSSMNKYISLNNSNVYNFFFLRKNRIFNKSRYSRNRQLYRTGVYWCLWLNIIIVYGLFFLFYRFTFNFGYLWFGLYILFGSFLISKVIKYNFINFFNIFKEFYFLIKWFGYIFNNILVFFKSSFKTFFKTSIILDNTLTFLFDNRFFFNFHRIFFNYRFFKNLLIFFKKLEFVQFTILWQEMKEKDTSFLRYKTIIHFLKQLTQINKMV